MSCKYCGEAFLTPTFGIPAHPQCVRKYLENLEARLHEVQEIYAGMEGFIPETAPEGYTLRIIEQMYRATLPEHCE